MPVSSHIIQMLENKNAVFDIQQVSDASALYHPSETFNNCIVNAVLLSDGATTYQLLFPHGWFVDIQEISQFLGRKLYSLDSDVRSRLLSEQELVQIPAIPHWNGYRTIVDDQLFNFKTIFLQSGSHDGVLAMNKKDFKALIETNDICCFSVKLEDPIHDAKFDEPAIKDSLTHFTNLRIQQRLDETLELPALPQTAQRIIELRADVNADINDLAEVVEQDPALAAQVVSWASSPYYSAPGKIKSIHDAIMRVLGFDMVLNLSLGIALGKTVETEVISREQLDQYWLRSVYRAAAMEALVTRIDKAHRPGYGMAYLSGLLHEFGFFILAHVFPPYFENIQRYQDANPHLDNMRVEQHLIGSSGNQISSWLLESWNMPDDVVVAIRQQFHPEYDGEYSEYSRLLYVAQQLLAAHGFGNDLPKHIPDKLFEDLHLDRESAEAAIVSLLDSHGDLNDIAKKLAG